MSYIDDTNIDVVFTANIKAPFDIKSCNYYPDWSDYTMFVETIAEYLVRIHADIRSSSVPVAILLPKDGYSPPSPCKYDYDTWNTALSNFKSKYYAFIGGLADVNFIEIANSLQVAGRIENLVSTTVTVVFPFTFNSLPVGREPEVYRYGKPYPEFVGVRRMQVNFSLADENWLTGSGFSIEIDAEESLTGIIVEYLFTQI